MKLRTARSTLLGAPRRSPDESSRRVGRPAEGERARQGSQPRGGSSGPKRSSGRHGGRGAGSTQGRRSDRPDWEPRAAYRPRPEGTGGPRSRDGRGGRPGPRDRDGDRSDRPFAKRGPKRRADGGRVCVVLRQGRYVIADPFFAPGERYALGRGEAKAGELVLVVPEGGPDGPPQIVARLGDPENTRDVLNALYLERDYSPTHAPEVLRAASEAVRAEDPHAATRRDLTGLPTFTIDPTTAKDFDDAISAEELTDGRSRIWVHIADVTSFVRPGDAIDRAGRARATSTYLPGLVARCCRRSSPTMPARCAPVRRAAS